MWEEVRRIEHLSVMFRVRGGGCVGEAVEEVRKRDIFQLMFRVKGVGVVWVKLWRK